VGCFPHLAPRAPFLIACGGSSCRCVAFPSLGGAWSRRIERDRRAWFQGRKARSGQPIGPRSGGTSVLRSGASGRREDAGGRASGDRQERRQGRPREPAEHGRADGSPAHGTLRARSARRPSGRRQARAPACCYASGGDPARACRSKIASRAGRRGRTPRSSIGKRTTAARLTVPVGRRSLWRSSEPCAPYTCRCDQVTRPPCTGCQWNATTGTSCTSSMVWTHSARATRHELGTLSS
jgi:hypothetical protein